jgi:transposase
MSVDQDGEFRPGKSRAAAERLTAGVDWASTDHAVAVVDGRGVARDRFVVAHRAADLRRLVTRLHRAGVSEVAIERGDGPVVDALVEAGLTVSVIAPNQLKNLRSRYGQAGNKDDRFDAFVLADVLRTDAHRLAPLVPDTAATQALRGLVRARKELIKHRIALHNQLLAHLLAAFPGAVGLFAELDSPISLRFLTRFPGPGRAGWLSERRLAAWLASVGYCGRKTPAELMTHLYRAPAGITGPAEHAMTVITDQFVTALRELRARIEVLDAEIAQALQLHPDGQTFTSLPRAGTNRAALLLAEIGDCRSRFPDDTALAAAARGRPIHPSQRQTTPRRLPAQLRQEAARGTHRLRRRQPPGQPMGRRHLRPRPSPRQTTPTRRAHPRPSLATRDLALLERPHHLRPGPPHRPTTAPRHSLGLTQGSQGSTSTANGRSGSG